MKQDPPAGAEVKTNATITLTISAGPEQFELPDVYNRTYEDAKKQLEENGLVVAPAVYEASEELEQGMVIRTEPARTTDPANPVLVSKGQEIRLIVSSGSNVKKVKVPSVLGMDEKNAKKELQSYGLKLGEKSYINSDVYADGLVCLQGYSVGQEVPEGTAIDVSISIGPEDAEPTEEPTDPGTTDPTPTETVEAKTYSTTVTITTNPFEVGGSGSVYLELEQDGEFIPIYEKASSYDTFESDFSNIRVEGNKEGTALVRMFIDDVLFSETWSVYLEEESAN
jgi:serine/threonine-protein kinase